MDLKIALAGNPNCGKTTLFNALTGSNQFVGNWPGVTVEKKEGKLKKHDGVTIVDLPGIYSLSPYTLEEVVARNYLVGERPDAILNMVDGTNLERNLYLTTQLTELGIPVVVAINMIDVVRKRGDKISIDELAKKLGCPVVEISALKEIGIMEAAEVAIEAAQHGTAQPKHIFSGEVEHAIAHIEEAAVHGMPEEQQRWYAIKIFERDEKALEQLQIPETVMAHIESDIVAAEQALDDDAESIITNERYLYIAKILEGTYKRKHVGMTASDKIDRVVTNRWAALPIFAVIMFLVYYISVSTIGTWTTDWTNDNLFGDGFHLFGIDGEYAEEAEEYASASEAVNGFIEDIEKTTGQEIVLFDPEWEHFDAEIAEKLLTDSVAMLPDGHTVTYTVVDEETQGESEVTVTKAELAAHLDTYLSYHFEEPDPSGVSPKTGEKYGVWVPGIPVLIGNALEKINCAEWLSRLILDGIVAGVGGVLGFVPQMLVLFLLLAFLEACGYMSRIAFVLDRIFRKFGLSGKSFIPMLVGTGCSVPGIMASRTIENQRDRRMTIITTPFIPCGAKLPFIAMIAGAIFGGAWWVAPSAYFCGIVAVVISGLILKKTKIFTGDPSPFVMELPAYHMPTLPNLLRSMWERGWSFIKKAGTVILLSTVVIWFLTYFGTVDGTFRLLAEDEVESSILAKLGGILAWVFKPLGFGTWQATVATMTGLVAKENIVSTLGVLYGGEGSLYATLATVFTSVSGYAFLVFNLLCAPCFAAIGAIKREMNSGKWTWFAIGYQCAFAYVCAMIVNYIGGIFIGSINVIGIAVSVLLLAAMIFLLVRPYRESRSLR